MESGANAAINSFQVVGVMTTDPLKHGKWFGLFARHDWSDWAYGTLFKWWRKCYTCGKYQRKEYR